MRVFISYSRDDEGLAHLLGYILTTAGIKCYVDRTIRAGRHFDQDIKEMIKKAEVVLVLLTKSSISSAWVNQEIGYAMAHDKKIWPIALEDHLEPTGMISMTESYALLDWTNPIEAIDNLLRALRDDGTLSHADLSSVDLDQVLTGRGARLKFLIQKFRDLAAETDRKITLYYQAGFSIFDASDDPSYAVPGVHTPETVRLALELRDVFNALIDSPHTTLRMVLWPTKRRYDERHLAARYRGLLTWLRSRLDDPSVEFACGPFPQPPHNRIISGDFVLDGYRVGETSEYSMTVARFRPAKVREAVQEFDVLWRQLWQGDKAAAIEQVEEMCSRIVAPI
jgi:hypothetical protein